MIHYNIFNWCSKCHIKYTKSVERCKICNQALRRSARRNTHNVVRY